jgi:hypothetical protein
MIFTIKVAHFYNIRGNAYVDQAFYFFYLDCLLADL